MVQGVRAAGGIGGPTPIARDATATAEGPFAVHDGASPAANSHPSSVAGIGLESMLALQAVDEASERDRSARKRGGAMLAALTQLQRTLLAEADPALALRTLNELAIEGPAADDPGLGAILRAVTLRCRVELARRARGG